MHTNLVHSIELPFQIDGFIKTSSNWKTNALNKDCKRKPHIFRLFWFSILKAAGSREHLLVVFKRSQNANVFPFAYELKLAASTNY